MSIAQRPHRTGHVVFTVAGTFGADDARELRRLLAELDPGGRVTVDFHDVRRLDDVAVSALGQGLGGGGPQVELVGLSDHHRRLLRYVGRG